MKLSSIFLDIIAASALTICYNCTTVEDDNRQRTIDVLRVQFPCNDATRVGVETDESLDLHFTWNAIDKLHFYAFQNLDGLHFEDLGESSATNISEDGKSCDFNIERPKAFDQVAPYSVYGVTGCESVNFENKINIYTYLQRTSLSQFSSPFWLKADVGYSFPKVEAQHVGTYELLHIKNTSGASIVFKLIGFESDRKWYYDNAAFIPETGEIRNNMAPVQTTGQSVAAIAKIESGNSATLISWYVPNGNKLENVTMVAKIDDIEIRSSNKKSSKANIQVGHAYHMYATWDGTELKFDNPNKLVNELGFEPNELELVEDGGYGYETTGREQFYTFESSNPTVATAVLNDELVGDSFVEINGHEIGKAIVTITDTGTGKKSQIKVTVSERFEYYAITEVGKTYEVAIKNKNGIYEGYVDDSSIASFTISGNVITVTGLKLGNTVIHVTEKTSGKQYTIDVYVNEADGGHVGPDNPSVEDGELDDVPGYEL
jgi:hypothetical protein